MKKYILLFGISFWCLIAFAQVSKVSPSRPVITDTITVAYHIGLPNARLGGQEVIYARITNMQQDGSIRKFHRVLLGNGSERSAKFVLFPFTASTKIEFYTLNKEDEAASLNLLVYEDDRGKPVKGAYFDALFGNKPDSIFRLEITNHPANYYAYARYINVVAMVKDPELAKVQIDGLLNRLDSISETNKVAKTDVGFRAAQCVGKAKMGDLAAAKSHLFKLFDAYPIQAETAFAFSIYNYEYYKSSSKQIEEDVRAKVKHIFMNFPTAAIVKSANVFEDLRREKDIPTLAFENALLPQYSSGEMPYYALGNLPELYIDRNEKLGVAETMLQEAIRKYQDASIQHQYRLNNGHYQMHVSLLLFDLAKISLAKKEHQSAILNASAAIQILLGSNVEGNFLPLLLQLRSNAYTEMGNVNLALADYEKLYRSGSTMVLDSMKRLFPLGNLKHKSFHDYLNTLKPSNARESLNTLANFSGTDLKGNAVSLSDLKGKIVVLNLWGTGCVPCIAEMPELNKLVNEFKNQPDVVFIAITGDDRERLVKFFKTRKFSYRVINNVGNAAAIFNTNSLPVHMVIGKNGEILNRSIGAREDINTFLKGIIAANL